MAAPVVEKAVKVATPVVEQVVKVTADAASPAIKAALPTLQVSTPCSALHAARAPRVMCRTTAFKTKVGGC